MTVFIMQVSKSLRYFYGLFLIIPLCISLLGPALYGRHTSHRLCLGKVGDMEKEMDEIDFAGLNEEVGKMLI